MREPCGRESNDYIAGWANDYFFKEIKKTGMGVHGELAVDIVINYGVKEVEDGIKNIYPDKIPHDYDWSDEFDVNKVVDGGVKVVPLPDMSGELRGYSDYYNTKEDRTKPHTEYIKESIEGGVKV